MSHYSTIAVELNDIESIKAACSELNISVKERGKIRYYFSQGVADADYVLSIQGCPYDVGLVKDPKTGNFNLVYDKYGGHVEKVLGKNCSKLVQSATYHRIVKKAKLKGFFVSRTTKDNKMQVVLTKA